MKFIIALFVVWTSVQAPIDIQSRAIEIIVKFHEQMWSAAESPNILKILIANKSLAEVVEILKDRNVTRSSITHATNPSLNEAMPEAIEAASIVIQKLLTNTTAYLKYAKSDKSAIKVIYFANALCIAIVTSIRDGNNYPTKFSKSLLYFCGYFSNTLSETKIKLVKTLVSKVIHIHIVIHEDPTIPRVFNIATKALIDILYLVERSESPHDSIGILLYLSYKFSQRIEQLALDSTTPCTLKQKAAPFLYGICFDKYIYGREVQVDSHLISAAIILLDAGWQTLDGPLADEVAENFNNLKRLFYNLHAKLEETQETHITVDNKKVDEYAGKILRALAIQNSVTG